MPLSAVLLLISVLAAGPSPAPLPAPGPGLAGTWTLVEQRYEGGPNNLADPERPLVLELLRDGLELAVRIRGGGDRDPLELPWPAFANDEGPLPVEVVELWRPAGGDRIRARYRVRPSDASDLVLEITEEYALTDGGRALAGRMEVRFTGGEKNRGGYVLHRRFERLP